jgi:hypothetical protein
MIHYYRTNADAKAIIAVALYQFPQKRLLVSRALGRTYRALDEAGKFYAGWSPVGWSAAKSKLVGFEQLLCFCVAYANAALLRSLLCMFAKRLWSRPERNLSS